MRLTDRKNLESAGPIELGVDDDLLTKHITDMDPVMGIEQWLLITLTAGVGGSLLLIALHSRSCTNGAHADCIHSSHIKMDLGHCPGLCREYHGTHIFNQYELKD